MSEQRESDFMPVEELETRTGLTWRRISAKDVLALLGNGRVPVVNYEDQRIQEIRPYAIGNMGQIGLTEALNAGCVHDRGAAMHDSRDPLLTAQRLGTRTLC